MSVVNEVGVMDDMKERAEVETSPYQKVSLVSHLF